MENIEIKKMTYGIDAMGHIDGKVVFVPYAAPGDRVKIKICEEKPDYNRAELVEVSEPSTERCKPACKNFPECGGCHWLHIQPETQRREKEDMLDFLLKSAGAKNIYPMEPLVTRAYRNKMDLRVKIDQDKVILGNYKYRSHEVVSIEGCIVQCKENMELYDKINVFMNLAENAELAKYTQSITVRTLSPQQHCVFNLKEPPTAEMLNALKAFFDSNESLSRLEIYSSFGNHMTQVREKQPFNFMKKNWRISPGSFFQNNLEGTEAILHTILSIYDSKSHNGKFLDLYAGVATQSFLLENNFDEVLAIESNTSSYQDAMAYLKTRHSSKVKLFCRKVETIFNSPLTKGQIAAVHLNPPRTGVSPRAMRGLSGIKPKIITYLSCNPTTFRRDAKLLRQAGMSLESVYSFDLFPGTFHAEVLGVFYRK